MTAAPSSRRKTLAVVVQSLVWLWLICLSVLGFTSYRTMHDSTDRERSDLRLVQLEGQVVELAEIIQDQRRQPAMATAAALREVRNGLEARLAQTERVLEDRAAAGELNLLRDEIEQIKQQQAKVRVPAATPQPAAKPVASRPAPPPLPFRIVGVELRAGERSVAVAPAKGDFTADQVRVLLPGDTVGMWALQEIAGDTAVFHARGQARRAVIP